MPNCKVKRLWINIRLQKVSAAVVYSLFIAATIVCEFLFSALFCYAVLCVLSSSAIILQGKRERTCCFTLLSS